MGNRRQQGLVLDEPGTYTMGNTSIYVPPKGPQKIKALKKKRIKTVREKQNENGS